MSYILEALKKAQAERQLGNAPTIHAVPLHAVAGDSPPARIKPIWIGVGAALLLAGVGVALMPRQPPALAPVAAPAPAPVAAPAPLPVPVAAAPVAPVAPPLPKAEVARKAEPAPKPRPLPKAVPAAPVKKAAPAAAPEDNTPALAQLPEAIRREVPAVAIGGYIYAKNPADSLLLVDKTLRREGEEVAPGLVLEKLLPKAAVMNYRGYRFRVPY